MSGQRASAIVAALAERGRRSAPHFLDANQAEPTRSATASASLEPSARPADTARALARAAQLLAASSHVRKTVFLLSLLARTGLKPDDPPWGKDGPILVVSADRGLCGSINSNINKAAERLWRERTAAGGTVQFAIVGRKARDYLKIWNTDKMNPR